MFWRPKDIHSDCEESRPADVESVYTEKKEIESVEVNGGEGEANVQDFKPSLRFYSVMLVLWLLTLLVAIDSTAISTALLSISSHLDASTVQAEWIANSYMVTAGAFQFLFSSLSDIYGRKIMIMFSFTFLLVGSLMCGVSKNISTLLAGRTIQGIGAAGTLVIPEVLVADLIPLRLRGVYFAILAGAWAVGGGIGPIIGGAFAQTVTWRWIFYLNLPICGASLVLTPFAMKLKKVHNEKTFKEKLGLVDITGNVLFLGSSISLMLGLSLGGISYPWADARTIIPIVVGGIGLLATGFYEKFYATNPMINVRTFANSSAIAAQLQNVIQGIVVMAWLYFLPMYFQGILLYSPLITGVAQIPAAVTLSVAGLIGGVVIRWANHYLFMQWIALALATLGMGLYMLLDFDTTVAEWIFLAVAPGIGMGILYSSSGQAVMAPIDPKLWTDAAAVLSFSRSLGEALGVAIGGAVFASQMKQHLSKINNLTIDPTKVIEVVDYIQRLPDSPYRFELQSALLKTTRSLMMVLMIFSAVALSLCLLMKEYSMEVVHISEQGVDDKRAE